MNICDYARRDQPCWGAIVTHKRYGTVGRDKGKLIEIVSTCTGHAEAGKQDKHGLYVTPPDPEAPDYWGKDQ